MASGGEEGSASLAGTEDTLPPVPMTGAETESIIGESSASSVVGGECIYQGAAAEYYLYDGGVLLATFDHNDKVIDLFVNGPTGRIASYYQDSTSQLYYFVTDQVGSTRVVMKGKALIGETQPNYVAEYYNYQPFGEVIQSWGNYPTAFKFSGKEHDLHGGFNFHYFGARYYDPRIGQFASIDKAGQFASGYVYGANNPIGGVDKDGNLFFLSTPFLLGALFGGGSYAMTTDNFRFDQFLGYAAFGGFAGYLGAQLQSFSQIGQSAVNSGINSIGDKLISGGPLSLNLGFGTLTEGQGFSVANPFSKNPLEALSGATGWMATGKDIFKAAYHLGTTPGERAQESALEARLDKEGEMGARQEYLKLNAGDAENMNAIRLDESTTNYNRFTHSDLKSMKPDGQIYRSMKGHYKFINARMDPGGVVRSFSLGELHINRIPSLGLGRRGPMSWISGALHFMVDGESHRWYTQGIESVRNYAVDFAEVAYNARGTFVY